jgi:predicted metal-dependent peptidase
MALGAVLSKNYTPSEIALKKLSIARKGVLERQPFFGQLLYYLEPKESPSPWFCDTMAVDYNYLYYFPDFVNDLNENELQGVLLHEIEHVIYHHPGDERMGARMPRIWGHACDYVVNINVIENGFTLPGGKHKGLYDLRFKNMPVESVYSILFKEYHENDKTHKKIDQTHSKRGTGQLAPDNEPKSGPDPEDDEDNDSENKSSEDTDSKESEDNKSPLQANNEETDTTGNDSDEDSDNDSDTPSTCDTGSEEDEGEDTDEDYKSDTSEDSEDDDFVDTHLNGKTSVKDGLDKELEDQKWKMRIAEAYQAAKSTGKVPGEIARDINELVEDKIPWKSVLTKYITSSCNKADFSWIRPNRRFVSQDMYLPGVISEGIRGIIGTDTSYSMSRNEITECISEVQGILRIVRSYELHLVPCDARTNAEYIRVLTEYDSELPTEYGGGGGTDFRPVFKYAEENGIRPDFMVYFTDGEGAFPEEAPEYPVIWCVTANGAQSSAFPFGTVIRMDEFDKKESNSGY